MFARGWWVYVSPQGRCGAVSWPGFSDSYKPPGLATSKSVTVTINLYFCHQVVLCCLHVEASKKLPARLVWAGAVLPTPYHSQVPVDIAPARSRCSKLEVLNVRQPPICGRRNSSAVGSVHLHQSCGRCSRIPFRCEVPQVNSFGITTCKKTGRPHQFRLHNC